MMQFFLVDVKNISSNVPRSNFMEADLDNLADIIVEAGGIIKPLVLKLTGAEDYLVVDGHFEYYAAVKAKEKNSRKCEMVNALVISPKIEDLVIKQAKALKNTELSDNSITTYNSSTTSLEIRLANLESRIEKELNYLKDDLSKESQRVDDKFKKFDNLIPSKSNPLDLLNTLTKDELQIKLQRSRISGAEKLAKAIFDARLSKKSKQEFEDYRDLVKSVKGLGDKTILTIIDEWSNG